MKWVAVAGVMIGLAVLMPGGSVLAQTPTAGASQAQAQDRWDRQAERTFGLARGQGRQLMTEKEWEQHRQTMAGMTEQERGRYQAEMHARLGERARDRATMPSRSSGMQGFGADAGGMGTSGGMGGGAGMGGGMSGGGGMGGGGGGMGGRH